jgi:hypothetical protein
LTTVDVPANVLIFISVDTEVPMDDPAWEEVTKVDDCCVDTECCESGCC